MQRLYIETMQDILAHTPAVIVDDKLKGVVPYLPLGDLGLKAPPTVIPPPPSGPQSAASIPTPARPNVVAPR
jgi:membrane protease subunit HflK